MNQAWEETSVYPIRWNKRSNHLLLLIFSHTEVQRSRKDYSAATKSLFNIAVQSRNGGETSRTRTIYRTGMFRDVRTSSNNVQQCVFSPPNKRCSQHSSSYESILHSVKNKPWIFTFFFSNFYLSTYKYCNLKCNLLTTMQIFTQCLFMFVWIQTLSFFPRPLKANGVFNVMPSNLSWW